MKGELEAVLLDRNELLAHYQRVTAENLRLKAECESWKATAMLLGHPAKMPCGHTGDYSYTEDGGKNIRCLLCSEAALTAERDGLKTLLNTTQSERRGLLGLVRAELEPLVNRTNLRMLDLVAAVQSRIRELEAALAASESARRALLEQRAAGGVA